MSCQWELLPVVLPGTDVVRTPGDAEYDAFVRAAFVDAADQLRASGFERVLWVLCPHQSLDRRPRRPARRSSATGATRPASTTSTRWCGTSPTPVTTSPSSISRAGSTERVDDAEIRPDGSHYEWERDTGVSAAMARLVDEALRQPG